LQQRAIDQTIPPPAHRRGFWRGLLKARGN